MSPLSQRGLSTLAVVIGLFFIVALAAAYANRHLMVEQRIARLAQDDLRAQVAAEQGLERALALLNAGAINDRCEPSSHGGARAQERWLSVDREGLFLPRASATDAAVLLCDRSADGEWDCRCAGETPPAPQAGGPTTTSSVRVALSRADGAPGHLWLHAQGCAQASAACPAQADWHAVESSTAISAVRHLQLAMLPALPQVPSSALLAVGPAELGEGMAVVNTDGRSHGLALRSGASVTGVRLAVIGPNGSLPEQRLLAHDPELRALGSEGLLRRLTGMLPGEWHRHPGLRTLRCSGPCRADSVEAAWREGARWVWVDGDLHIDRDMQWGSDEQPMLLLVSGGLNWASPGRLVGALIVQGSAELPQADAQARLDGALVVGQSVRGGAATQVVHNADVLQRLQRTVGSFLRAPGGHWRPA